MSSDVVAAHEAGCVDADAIGVNIATPADWGTVDVLLASYTFEVLGGLGLLPVFAALGGFAVLDNLAALAAFATVSTAAGGGTSTSVAAARAVAVVAQLAASAVEMILGAAEDALVKPGTWSRAPSGGEDHAAVVAAAYLPRSNLSFWRLSASSAEVRWRAAILGVESPVWALEPPAQMDTCADHDRR
ncbi:hypothetical protein PI124_g19839 [Phytophthora idaei]|nr:hypothetical protein PI125_g18946 [Phytophthora idaei]KAG3135593.1 hypothetical protein PI126_g18185 [Phytophthora idaei]KAG3235123.1 hypothetical protein PI124_g19839 [Phytophthora idaei]